MFLTRGPDVTLAESHEICPQNLSLRLAFLNLSEPQIVLPYFISILIG